MEIFQLLEIIDRKELGIRRLANANSKLARAYLAEANRLDIAARVIREILNDKEYTPRVATEGQSVHHQTEHHSANEGADPDAEWGEEPQSSEDITLTRVHQVFSLVMPSLTPQQKNLANRLLSEAIKRNASVPVPVVEIVEIKQFVTAPRTPVGRSAVPA